MGLIRRFERRDFLIAQFHINSSKELFQMMNLRGSDYGRCDARRLEYPGTGNLGRCDTPLFGDLFHCRGNNEIVLTKIIIMGKRIGFRTLGQGRATLRADGCRQRSLGPADSTE